MLYDETKHTKQQLIAGYLMAGVPLLFGFYMSIWGFGQIADKKAQNPDNLIRGCMYYNGYRKDKHNHESFYFRIEKEIAISDDLFRGGYYDNIKKSFLHIDEFYNYAKLDQKKCFLVSYIKLDYILFQKFFVYDYHGTKSDNHNPLSTTQSE